MGFCLKMTGCDTVEEKFFDTGILLLPIAGFYSLDQKFYVSQISNIHFLACPIKICFEIKVPAAYAFTAHDILFRNVCYICMFIVFIVLPA